jgi:hypothetical protein
MAEIEAEYEGDPFGLELAESIRSNKALLQGLRYDLGQKMLQAQEENGEMPSPFEVAAVKKLEQSIRNDEMFAQARRLTRDPETA